MLWRRTYWTYPVLISWLIWSGCIASSWTTTIFVEAMSTERRIELRELVRETWYHGYRAYMKNAFPADELRPLTCDGLNRDRTDAENEVNDVMGGFKLTLVDALDTFVILGDKPGFEQAVRTVIEQVHFNLDVRVQVFEVTIRVMGGLLSSHIFATDTKYGFDQPWYNGELLHLAHDLGKRLLPAFTNSPTGIPWARVNLARGHVTDRNPETCSAAAGSLILEFAALSRLTGDPVFEQVARTALFRIWDRRSPLSLIGDTIDIQTGQWITTASKVGAGIDSFFEYVAKAYVLLGEHDYHGIWLEAYTAIEKHMKSADGYWYRSVNMYNGRIASVNVDSLSAFFPGVQVLMGDLQGAIHSHATHAMLWKKYSGSPEVFNTQTRQAEIPMWPLRPELVESTLFLYQATKHKSYLDLGERIITDIVNRTKLDCGLAALANVQTGEKQNRLHSFMLSETLPYLYLLFDEDNILNREHSNGVFTTEGHWLSLNKTNLKKPGRARQRPAPTCRRHDSGYPGLINNNQIIPGESDYVHALVNFPQNAAHAESDFSLTSTHTCKAPEGDDYRIYLHFPASGNATSPRLQRNIRKLDDESKAFLLSNVTNIAIQATRRLASDGGYLVTDVGPVHIPFNHTVYVSDPAAIIALKPEAMQCLGFTSSEGGITQVTLRLAGPGLTFPPVIIAIQAGFGPSFASSFQANDSAAVFAAALDNPHGCSHLRVPTNIGKRSVRGLPMVALVQRGGCTFFTKMRNAADAGINALLILGDDDEAMVPSADAAEVQKPGKRIPTAMLTRSASHAFLEAVKTAGGVVDITIVPPPTSDQLAEIDEMLASTPVVINGYHLVNCQLRRPQ